MKLIIKRAFEIWKNEGTLSITKKGSSYIKWRFKFILLPYAMIKIKTFNTTSLDNLLDFSFNSIAELIKPMQVREEIEELLKILNSAKPKVILEIGTANGGTLFLFSRVASEDAIIISIDLPGGKFGGGYPKWKIPLYKSFEKKNQRIYLIRENSHKQEALEKVKKILNDKRVDSLFIDGDHSYEGVKRDFEMYSPLVRKGGIIAFHDIVPGPEENVGGVPRFWQEIKQKYKHKEIVKDWNQKGWGIGVIYKM